MPVNLLAIVFNWFATHLVLFSLLGFVFVGLLVFGVIDMQGAAPAGHGEPVSSTFRPHPANRTPPDSDLPAAAVAEPGRAGAASEKADVGGEEARSKKAGRPAPKLIGGSLPIYGQSGEAPAARGAVSGSAAEPFRPPGEDPLPGPVVTTRDDYLQQARRAFWSGEFETSEAAYMALISDYPADADAFGELGNLYQSMGKPDRALDAFYEAGVRLKAAGESEKLKEIIELLTREGDGRAEQLTP
jgi:hypothetical protein